MPKKLEYFSYCFTTNASHQMMIITTMQSWAQTLQLHRNGPDGQPPETVKVAHQNATGPNVQHYIVEIKCYLLNIND